MAEWPRSVKKKSKVEIARYEQYDLDFFSKGYNSQAIIIYYGCQHCRRDHKNVTSLFSPDES